MPDSGREVVGSVGMMGWCKQGNFVDEILKNGSERFHSVYYLRYTCPWKVRGCYGEDMQGSIWLCMPSLWDSNHKNIEVCMV